MVEAGVGERVYNDKLGVFNVDLMAQTTDSNIVKWYVS